MTRAEQAEWQRDMAAYERDLREAWEATQPLRPQSCAQVVALRRARLISRREARIYLGLAQPGWRGWLLDRLRRLLG